ncbi:MAG: translation initiation factor IF-6 [Candidatus Aenigmarchaeota archaeon]|nr:translation initiation factor IF-6 [Candidatus Aenigmarchaeota archaeon]
MHLEVASFEGNPNLGLFSTATDSFCISGSSRFAKLASEILKVPHHEVLVSESRAIGIFTAANSNGILVPHITEKSEIAEFKKLGINVCMLKTKETALGNLIALNDKGCIMSPYLLPYRKEIFDCFGCEVVIASIAGLDLVGSSCVATNKGFLTHRDCTEREFKIIEDVLKVKGEIGTANFGSPFVGAFIVANSNGFIASEQTTGPELARIDEALGFI